MNGRAEGRSDVVVEWPPPRQPRRIGRLLLLALVVLAVLAAGSALSFYVDALWFESLGFLSVFWTTLNLRAAIFGVFTLATFGILYGAFLALKPAGLADFTGGAILINGQPLRLPVEPVLRLIALGLSLAIA